MAVDDKEKKVLEAYRRGLIQKDEARSMLAEGSTGKVRPPSFLPESVQDFGAGAYQGMMHTVAGPIQFTLDAVAPGSGQAFSDFVKKNLDAKNIFKDSTEFTAGEIGGAAVSAFVPGSSVGRAPALARAFRGLGAGFVMGSTQFQEGDTREERERGRLVSGGAGAALGAVVDPLSIGLSKTVSKIANSKKIDELQGHLQGVYENVDQGLKDLQVSLTESLSKVGQGFTERTGALDKWGAKVRIDGAVKDNLTQTINVATGEMRKVLKGNPEAEKVLDEILKRTGTGKGDPALKAVEALDSNIFGLSMPLDTKEKIIQQLRSQNLLRTTTYKDLRQITDDLGDFLATKEGEELKQPVFGALKQLHEGFTTAMGAVEKTHPKLRRLAEEARNFKSEYVDAFDDPALKKMLTARSDENRGAALADIVMRGDKEVTEKFAKILGEPGRQKVNKLLVSRSIMHSVDARTGEMDPARMTDFWERVMPGAKSFIGEREKQSIEGIKNLISERARLLSEAPAAPKIRTFHGPEYVTAYGLFRMLHGDPVGGAKVIATGYAGHSVIKTVNNMLEDRLGKSLLAAASRAKPGTPRMAKVMEAISQRFGPGIESAGALEAGEADAQ